MVTWGPLALLISSFVRRTPFFFGLLARPLRLADRRQSRPILLQAIAEHAAKADLHTLHNPKALRSLSRTWPAQHGLGDRT